MPLRPRHSARAHRAFWRHWTLWIYFPLALFLVAGGVFLWRSGHWLVHEDPFGKSAWAVVLAGEVRETERADAALKLYLDGRIDSLIYSGMPLFKTRYTSEFLTDYLAGQGFPREKLFEFRNDGYSTLEEARMVVRQLRLHDIDTVVIVTVNFHTARARRIYRKLAQGYPHILVYPAESPFFIPSSWWSTREGRKYWLTEWTKTVATWFELMAAPPETGKAESSGLIGAMGLTPSSDLPPAALLESIAAGSAARDTAGPADSLSAPGRDTADTAASAPADSARTAIADTAERGAEAGEREDRPEAREKPAASLAARETPARKEASKGSAKDTAAPKASARTPAKAPAKKVPEKEKAKKKPSR